MNKLSKDEYLKLYSDDTPKKEYDRIITKIDERFGEVVLLIHPTITSGRGWFVYGNYNYNDERDEGFFDPQEYENEISIGGECEFPEPYCFTNEGNGYIPTKWLWADNKEILKEFSQEIKKCKNEKLKEKKLAQQKRADLKERKSQFKQIIQSKLTKEELKYIKFK